MITAIHIPYSSIFRTDIGYIFDYALRCHASYLDNKSAPIPSGTRAEIERFLRRLGYRLVIRNVEHDAIMQTGTQTRLTIAWENIGVAPPYRDYRLALRLKNTADDTLKPWDTVTDMSIRGWLPGLRETAMPLRLPGSISPGIYELAVGVLDPENRKPAVRLAIAGRDTEGWYPVSRVEVVVGEKSATSH